MKQVNGACDVWEKLVPRDPASSQAKGHISAPFSKLLLVFECPYLKNYKSDASGNSAKNINKVAWTPCFHGPKSGGGGLAVKRHQKFSNWSNGLDRSIWISTCTRGTVGSRKIAGLGTQGLTCNSMTVELIPFLNYKRSKYIQIWPIGVHSLARPR
jgi:hypothetical protein